MTVERNDYEVIVRHNNKWCLTIGVRNDKQFDIVSENNKKVCTDDIESVKKTVAEYLVDKDLIK